MGSLNGYNQANHIDIGSPKKRTVGTMVSRATHFSNRQSENLRGIRGDYPALLL
jgi:hypothetical protein